MIKEVKRTSHVKVDPSLKDKYKGKILFKEKYDWAVNHIKGRDIQKEIEAVLEKEKISRP